MSNLELMISDVVPYQFGHKVSYGEQAELQGLVPYIDNGDVELLEAAGVPEFTV